MKRVVLIVLAVVSGLVILWVLGMWVMYSMMMGSDMMGNGMMGSYDSSCLLLLTTSAAGRDGHGGGNCSTPDWMK